MAFSYQNYPGDGVTDTFSIPFDYTDQSEISVTVNGVAETGLTFPSSSSVQLTSAPALSTLVQVRRTTDLTTRAIDFASGSVLTEEDLDDSNIQVFHAAQEAVDIATDSIPLDLDDKWDAKNKVIKNVANPVNNTDAVNKQFISTNLPNINTVAGIASDVTTVAGISSDVTAVAADATDIGTVSTNIASVNTVATNISDVVTVANDLNEAISEVETAALDLQSATSKIDTVSTNIADVNTVGGDIANVNLVAGEISPTNNISTVAGINTDISTVASNNLNITTVAGQISPTNNISTVAGINSDITTVAGNNANVTTVATDITNVNTVATDIANVNLVGADITNVNTVATNILDVNNFADTYFISATAPSSPTTGDLWFDTTNSIMKVYDGSGFVNAGSSVNGTAERSNYVVGTASGSYTGSTTTFPATYDAGYVDVYLNGIKLVVGDDFTATNGTTVVLATAAASGASVDIVAYGTFDVADVGASLTTLGISNHNNLTVDGSGNVSVSGTLGVTGVTTLSNNLDIDGNELILDADGDTSITSDTDDQIDVKVAGTDEYSFTGTAFNIKGNDLILDADADSKIEASTDDTINIISGGTTGFTMNSAGVITQPTKPMFDVRGVSGQSITANTFTLVQFNNEKFDIGGYYDSTTNYRYTPLVAGKYYIYGRVYLSYASSAITQTLLSIFKNGGEVARNYRLAGTASYGTVQVSAIIDFNGTTDYVDIRAFQNSSTDASIYSDGVTGAFSGYLIG